MASLYAATEETTNSSRISRLLIGPVADQLRDLFRSYVAPASFPAVIQREKYCLPRLSEAHRKLILPQSGGYSGNYSDMDISLLYALLRNICGITAHATGWGETPNTTDRSVSANIERIRLARNRCGHTTGGISNADFNQIWSELRGSVVDLDLHLGNGNKYEKEVDGMRFDTMDPEMEKRYIDQLLKQTTENEATMKEVDHLKRQTQEMDEQIKQKMQKLESSVQVINNQTKSLQDNLQDAHIRVQAVENRNIPVHIKKQHQKLLETWQTEDKPFHEVHSFANILDKVQSQQITTIIGGPGTGKTATARHIALLLQTDFEIVPVLSPSDVIQYGQTECKQLFILDDVIGVFGVERGKYIKLEDYRESIVNVLSLHSKILFTCRKALYKEAAELESFVLMEECIVDLEDDNNRLNDQDRIEILNNHCIENAIPLSSVEKPTVSSTVGIMMYPLLCKLFCSESKYRALGKKFFENPNSYILREINLLQKHKRIQYASLVLCMFCKNEITKHLLRKKDPGFMEIREEVFESCRVSGRNTEIQDALDNMVNTFTTRTSNGYSLIHDSVYEVLASHYGNKHQENMLQYMSSSFVAKKFVISKMSDDPDDLYIKLHKEHYGVFAERLVRDLKCLELHDVFMNKTLKDHCVCYTFIDELKKLSYLEMKQLFFHKQEDVSKIIVRSKHVGNELESRQTTECELDRQSLLVGGTVGGTANTATPDIRVISWVIYYGHSQLLHFLFDQVTQHQESLPRVMGWEIPKNDKDGNICDLAEQTRLLILSCYSGDLEVVKLLLKHCDAKCINNKSQFTCHMFYDHRYITPLTAACARGHKPVVDELIRCGASIDQQDEWGITPLYVAAESGQLAIVESLIQAGADCNACDLDGITPLFAAAHTGYLAVVDYLQKHDGDVNKPDIYKKTPMYEASQAGHCAVVDLLIRCGADCNKADMDGRTPLFVASKSGHESIVRALIAARADIGRGDTDGETPLSVAIKHDQTNIADILLKHGGKLNPTE